VLSIGNAAVLTHYLSMLAVLATGTNSAKAAKDLTNGRSFVGVAAKFAGYSHDEIEDADSQEVQVAISTACSKNGT
jgi:hypothetical protein